MTFLALYFSSRDRLANSASRAGLASAYSAARRRTSPIATALKLASTLIQTNDKSVNTGKIINAGNSPKRTKISGVTNISSAKTIRLVTKSSCAKNCVRSAGFAKAVATRRCCSKYITVPKQASSSISAHSHSSSGLVATSFRPSHRLPPMATSSSAVIAPLAAPRRPSQTMMITQHTIKPAESSKSAGTPILFTETAVSVGPASAPNVPPAAMKPKSRLACSLFHKSTMKLQNTDTAKRLKTVTQM